MIESRRRISIWKDNMKALFIKICIPSPYSITVLRISMRNNSWLTCNTDLGPARVEITGDVPEIGTHARPRLPLVEDQAEVTAAGGTVAVVHLDRARLHDRALRGEASSRPWPWARQRCTVAVDTVTLRELEGRVSHRAAGDRNCHLGRRRWQLIHGRLHQVWQRQARQVLDVAGLQPDYQRLLRSGSTGRPIYRTKKRKISFETRSIKIFIVFECTKIIAKEIAVST